MTTNSLFTGFTCILLIQFVSTLIIDTLQIQFPPALLGMILLTMLLLCKALNVTLVEDACTLLLEKMGMLFVPAGVSIL
ncbi:MAG TPA: CidA/LrgA family protein, partial [Candidatus Avacidaminococcus intestinavium]|nr:CidA/LrgA family protein [Candidatus Avacidaminococcus intestinavium]